jgi:hypothetical protein
MKALPNQQREVQCAGKEAFQSASLAKEVASRKTRRADRRGMNAYHCPYCGAWHIGHHKSIKKPRFYDSDE